MIGQVQAVCSTCDDHGVVQKRVPYGHPDFNKVFPCPHCEEGRRVQARKSQQRVKLEEISSQYLKYGFDDFFPYIEGKQRAVAAARLFADNPEMPLTKNMINQVAFGEPWEDEDAESFSLVLHGDFGTGKTVLAGAICNEVTKRWGEGSAIMVRLSNVMEAIRQSYDRHADSEDRPPEPRRKEILDRLIGVKLLVLDEVSMEPVSDHSREVLETILRNRDAEDRPFILTTNWTSDYFKSKWGLRAGVIALKAHWIRMGGIVLRPQPGMKEF